MIRPVPIVVLAFVLTGCGDPSDAEFRSECPGITRDAIARSVGVPTSFEALEPAATGFFSNGTATVGGKHLTWYCGDAVTKGKVLVDVRDAEGSPLITNFFALP